MDLRPHEGFALLVDERLHSERGFDLAAIMGHFSRLTQRQRGKRSRRHRRCLLKLRRRRETRPDD